MSGGAGAITDKNAHVRLLVFADRIRKHPMGSRVGKLLGAADQWRDFFGPTTLDPIKDVDRILIAGPQLRDSSKAIVVLKHSAGRAKVRKAVDDLVKRGKKRGAKWLPGEPVPVAVARADRADRMFALVSKDIVVVAPPGAKANVLKQRKGLKFPAPKGKEAVVAFVRSPSNALRGHFPIPKSIKWVRLKIIPTADGGAYADVLAEDESPQAAKKNAADLTRRVNAMTQLGFIKLLERTKFVASGTQIKAKVVAKRSQLRPILDVISTLAKELAEEARKTREEETREGSS